MSNVFKFCKKCDIFLFFEDEYPVSKCRDCQADPLPDPIALLVPSGDSPAVAPSDHSHLLETHDLGGEG